jgi:hypothetical protein
LKEVDLEDKKDVFTDLEDLFMFRYGLSGERVEEIDRKYLPQIYEAIVSHHPELKDYILRSFKSAGVDLSIFQKTPV